MVCVAVTSCIHPEILRKPTKFLSPEGHIWCLTVTSNCSVPTEDEVVIEQIARVAKFAEHSVIVFPSEQQTNNGAAGVCTADGGVKPVISALATSAR